jgi:hypothetical protein
MVHITIDTEKDSTSTIQHTIALLKDELQRRGNNYFDKQEINEEYRSQNNNEEINTRENKTNNYAETNNPFEMFGSGLPSSGRVQPKQELNVPVGTAISEEFSEDKNNTNDLFGAFNNETNDKNHIILEAPPRKEPEDFENSARFAKQVSAQDLINSTGSEKKEKNFFKDLDFY